MVKSFFGTLKAEHMQGQSLTTRAQAVMAVFEYNESFCRPGRRHSSLGYVSPLVFGLQ